MKKSDELRQSIAALGDSLQTISDSAEQQGRDLTGDESTTFNTGIRKLEGLRGQLETEIEVENNRSILRATRANMHDLQDCGIPTDHQPVVNVMQPRLSAFQDAGAAARSGLWLKDFLHGNMRAVQTEGTNSAGGFTVPSELHKAIVDVREEHGVSRKLAKVYEMGSDVLSVPRLLSGSATTYPGEAGVITASDPVWGEVSFTATKRATLIKISNELLHDNIVSLGDFVATMIGKDQAVTEDGEFILGDGTATYGGETGLLAALGAAGVYTAASGVDTWPELTMADFTGTMALLPSKYTGPLSWLCSREFYYSVMLRLLAAAGGNTTMVLEAGGASQPSFLGSPVYFSSQMPTASAVSTVSALFGSFSESTAIGSRVTVEVQQSSDRFFDEDVHALRGISRYDINIFDLGDASDAGGVVGLATSST